MVEFIERVSQEEDLVGDGSTSHSLSTIPGKHADLKSITTDTVRGHTTVIQLILCCIKNEFESKECIMIWNISSVKCVIVYNVSRLSFRYPNFCEETMMTSSGVIRS